MGQRGALFALAIIALSTGAGCKNVARKIARAILADELADAGEGATRPGASVAAPSPGPGTPAPTTTRVTTTSPSAVPATAPLAAAPAPGGGLAPGTYNCFGLVGRSYTAHGSFTIVDGSRYTIGSDPGTYVFDPKSKKIRWTSGLYANPASVKDAWQAGPHEISMRTGKDGFYQWDCTRGK